jgi:predicted nuclease with TOPRIM domain
MSQYLVTSSFNEDRIYIKIIDTSTYLCYEGNFDIDNFKVMMTIKEIYDICLKSFEEGTYNVVFINKFIKLEPFGLILKNTLLSIEQLSINYHKQVFENSVLMNKLEKVCESLEAKISENSVLTKRVERLETKISENSVLTERFEKLETKISENSVLTKRFEKLETKISENSVLTKRFEKLETKISENSVLTERFEKLETKISENSVLTKRFEKLETKISENSVLTKRFEKLETKISENSVLTKRFEKLDAKISENSVLTKKSFVELSENMKSIMQTSVIQILKLPINTAFNSHCQIIDELYPQFVQINIDKLNIRIEDIYEMHDKLLYKNIEQLYNLEILLIHFDDDCPDRSSRYTNYLYLKNINVKRIKLIYDRCILQMLEFIKNFPNLCELEFASYTPSYQRYKEPPINLKDALQKYPNKIKLIKSPVISQDLKSYLESANITYES